MVAARHSDPVLDPIAECLTADVARRLLEVRIAPSIQARVERLAAKANEGELTEEERQEYEALIEKADLLGIFKSLARQVPGCCVARRAPRT